MEWLFALSSLTAVFALGFFLGRWFEHTRWLMEARRLERRRRFADGSSR